MRVKRKSAGVATVRRISSGSGAEASVKLIVGLRASLRKRRAFYARRMTFGSIRGMTNVAAASEMLKPYVARLMRSYPVSMRINHVANDDEECSRPVEIAEAQNRLFA